MDIRIQRSWMYNRMLGKDFNPEWLVGVNQFIEFAKSNIQNLGSRQIRCPCRKCKNKRYADYEEVHADVLANGFVADYWYWTCHGEVQPYNLNTNIRATTSDHIMEDEEDNIYEDVVYDAMRGGSFDCTVGDTMNANNPPNAEAQKFYETLDAAQRPLYEGCNTHSELSLALQLMALKADYNMTHGCFNRMTQILKTLPPKENLVPNDFYRAKKLVAKLGLSYQKIDCCENGCMLNYKEDQHLTKCKFCKFERFKKSSKSGCDKRTSKLVPHKRMHYLPLIPRLKRLYASPKSAPHMRWHFENRKEEGVLCHPSDGLAWKNFDTAHREFAAEPRNVRLGLCSDGFNPFAHNSEPYSCWPVIVTPYNLPPEMCMTTPYMFLTCLIPGPHNPKSRIDVYLRPLIDELNHLWVEGVETYDISRKDNFRMRAALMWTINDFPAYGMLAGWMTSGKLACPICLKDTKSFSLKYGGKVSWFDCHRRFLPERHPFRESRSFFKDGKVDMTLPPRRLTGHEEWQRVCNLPKISDLPLKHANQPGYGSTHHWTKQSIFWELPYWKDNLVRHNLDVMHIEKNVFDNVINTVMDVKGKTKDNDKARRDVQEYCRRSELHLRVDDDGKFTKPKASYTLSRGQKQELCKWVEDLKMPDGYASNLARCVDNTNLRLHGLKSHDCHVFMQRLLPTAFSMLPQHVWKPLTELGMFFRDLCSTELRIETLQQMEKDIPLIICKLERIFPPGFFNSMEHLPIHLPYEAIMCGPVQYRWMYPFERFLHDLKGMVGNRARIEGSICQAYLLQEASYFTSFYFESNIETRSTRIRRNEINGRLDQTPHPFSIFNQTWLRKGKSSTKELNAAEMAAARLHVLKNCDEVVPFLEHFIFLVRRDCEIVNEAVIENSIEDYFVKWFNEYIYHPSSNIQNQHLQNLSWSPCINVKRWRKCVVNGYTFHTHDLAANRKTYNAGVCVKGEESTNFYGILEEFFSKELP